MTLSGTCEDCEYRKILAKTFDIHLDWRDCWHENCKYKKQKEKESDTECPIN